MSITGTHARSVTVLIVLVAVVGVSAVGPVQSGSGSREVAGPPVTESSPGQTGSFAGIAQIEGFDEVEIQIQVAGDRSATWRVKYRYELDDELTSEAFERVRRNVSNPPGVFIERMRDAARRVEQRTDRAMRIQNGTVSAYESAPHGRFGIVEYRFTWVGFAAAGEDESVVVSGVLDGYPLGANETLVLDWQEQFQIGEITPAPDATGGSTARWNGPHEFEVDRPRLVLTTGGRSVLWPAVSVLLLGVVVVVAGVLVYRLGTERLRAVVTSPGEEGEQSGQTPTELLSDEERVLRLLEENGGRMKQQELKDELDWSRTKTSNVVNELQDADKIEVYRLGRENTLALPGEMDI